LYYYYIMQSQYTINFNRLDRTSFTGTDEDLIKCLEENINLNNMHHIYVYIKSPGKQTVSYKFDDSFDCLEPYGHINNEPIIETPTIHEKIVKLLMVYKIIIGDEYFHINSMEMLMKTLEEEITLENYKDVVVEHNQYYGLENYKDLYHFDEKCTKLIKFNGSSQFIETPNIHQKLFGEIFKIQIDDIDIIIEDNENILQINSKQDVLDHLTNIVTEENHKNILVSDRDNNIYTFDDQCTRLKSYTNNSTIETPTIHQNLFNSKVSKQYYVQQLGKELGYCESYQDLIILLETIVNQQNYQDIQVRCIRKQNNSVMDKLFTFDKKCTKLITLNNSSIIETPTIAKKIFAGLQYICFTPQSNNLQEMNYVMLKQHLSDKTVEEIKNMTIYDFQKKATYKFSEKNLRFEDLTAQYLQDDLIAHLFADYKVILSIHDIDEEDNPYKLIIKEICHRKILKQKDEQKEMEEYRQSIMKDKSFEKNFNHLIENSYLAGLYFVKNGKIIGSVKDKMVFYYNHPYKRNINGGPFIKVCKEIDMYWELVHDLNTFFDTVKEYFVDKVSTNQVLTLNDNLIEKASKNPDLMMELMMLINVTEILSLY